MKPMDPKKLKKISTLGTGAYGRVYAAETEDHRSVVVKRNIIPQWCGNTTLSIREWNILKEVEPSVFCIGLNETIFGNPFTTPLSPIKKDESNDSTFFVMEKGSTDGKKYSRGHNSFKSIINFIIQTALGLEFLHSRGIIHRDLKPDNIIVFLEDDKLKYCKIADFGISDYHCTQGQPLDNVVTEWYRAPEILLCKPYDYKSDVWSFACIIYEMIVGSALFGDTKGENQIMQSMMLKFPFEEDEFYLAKDKYSKVSFSYHYHRANALGVKILMDKFPSSFKQELDKRNLTSHFQTMLQALFETNPDKRWSITHFLNDRFFETSREYIDHHRRRCHINDDGEWLPRPRNEITYLPTNGWILGVKYILSVFKQRSSSPFRNWYAHRICFHVLSLFNRLSSIVLLEKMKEFEIQVMINSLFFIMAKFFRTLMEGKTEIKDFTFICNCTKENLEEMEKHLLHKFFCGRVYYPTLYEKADIHLSDKQIAYIFIQIANQRIPSGTEVTEAWETLREKINDSLLLELTV